MTKRQMEDRQREVDAKREARGEVRTIKLGRRTFSEGDRITFTGVRGEFTFRFAQVVNDECVSITAFGGKGGMTGQFRSFHPDRIKAKKRATVDVA